MSTVIIGGNQPPVKRGVAVSKGSYAIIINRENLTGALEWQQECLKLGIELTGAEAREAADFGEVLLNYGQEPDDYWKLLKGEGLTVGKRIYFAGMGGEDVLAELLLQDTEEKVSKLAKARLDEIKREKTGGLVV